MAEIKQDSIHIENHRRNARNETAMDENTPLLDFSFQQNKHSSASAVPSSPDISDDDFSLTMPTKRRVGNYYRLMCLRRPKSQAVFLIFLIFFLENIASYSAQIVTKNVVPIQYSTLISTLLYSTAGRVFYPIAGVLADCYLGRYNVIHLGFWLFWSSFAVLTLSLGLNSYMVSHNLHVLTSIVLPVVSILLYSAGSGSVEAVIIPFGVDQLSAGASSDELSSYFYYYYMTINVATLMTILLLLSLFDTKAWFLSYPSKQAGEVSEQLSALNMNILNVAVCVVALLAITTALLIMYCLKKRFFRDKRRANPIKLIAGVLYFAASVKRHEPYLNRAFRYGEGRKHRIELAKQKYDGIYTSEEVEDVKTFCWILFLLISFVPGYTFSYGGGLAFLTSALTNTTLAIVPGNPYFASNIIWVINCGIIIIILPVINHLVLPFWPNVSIKSKLGVGILLNVLSLAFGGYIIWWQNPLTSEQLFCWLVLPALLISIAEALVFVSALEFIYAQSPDNMKGLLTGLLYFIFAIFSSLGSLFDYNYTHSPKRDAWFLFILLVVSMLGLVVYALAARCYQNRKRPASDGSEDEVKRRGIYENVFSQRFT